MHVIISWPIFQFLVTRCPFILRIIHGVSSFLFYRNETTFEVIYQILYLQALNAYCHYLLSNAAKYFTLLLIVRKWRLVLNMFYIECLITTNNVHFSTNYMGFHCLYLIRTDGKSTWKLWPFCHQTDPSIDNYAQSPGKHY